MMVEDVCTPFQRGEIAGLAEEVEDLEDVVQSVVGVSVGEEEGQADEGDDQEG